jgi:hypothetical protein
MADSSYSGESVKRDSAASEWTVEYITKEVQGWGRAQVIHEGLWKAWDVNWGWKDGWASESRS